MSKLTKPLLRKLIGESLKNVSSHDKRLQSDIVAKVIFQHPKYKSASRISLYLSTQDEIDTLEILQQALEVDTKRCFIPLVVGKRNLDDGPRLQMVEIKSMAEYESLPLNKYGIKEPLEAAANLNVAEMGELDLMLVPGVAFSLDARRLGHGKGYYDEFLNHWLLNGHSVPYCIGLALREQIVADTLAQDDHDYKLDEVVVAPEDLSSLKK